MRNHFNVERHAEWESRKNNLNWDVQTKCNLKLYSTKCEFPTQKNMFNYLNFSPSFQLDYKRLQFAVFVS